MFSYTLKAVSFNGSFLTSNQGYTLKFTTSFQTFTKSLLAPKYTRSIVISLLLT